MSKMFAVCFSLLLAITLVLPVGAASGVDPPREKAVRLDNQSGPSNWEAVAEDGTFGLVLYATRDRAFIATVVGMGLQPNTQYLLRLDGPASGEWSASDELLFNSGRDIYGDLPAASGAINPAIGHSRDTGAILKYGGWRDSAFLVLAVATTNPEGNFGTSVDVGLKPGEYSGMRFSVVQNSPPRRAAIVQTETLSFIIT